MAHLNYCTIHKLDGYAVCKDCKGCAYNKNIRVVNEQKQPNVQEQEQNNK